MNASAITLSRQVVALVAAFILTTTSANALQIFVDQDATYKYINATTDTDLGDPGPGWFSPGFDDSEWYSGSAPFSSNGTTPFGSDLANAGDPFGGSAPPIPGTTTQWDVNFDPFLRTEFHLDAPTALTVWIAVDNGIGPYPSVPGSTGMYINGVEGTAAVNAEGAAFRWEHVFDIAAEFTLAGTNLFALQLEDHGGSTAFTMVITEDDPTMREDFSTNPPPMSSETGVPEPATVLLLGLALAGFGGMRNRTRGERSS